MIEIKNLSKTYVSEGNVSKLALSDVSLEFKVGKFYAITGPSGSGKSTLLNILALLLRFETGKYFIEGKEIKNISDKYASRLRNNFFGFVVQDYELLESETVLFNIELPGYIGNFSKKLIRERSKKLIKYLDLEEQKNKKVMNLSGGQKQRVAIARALINSPKVILADEPTGALDYENGLHVINIFKEIAANENVTVIMVSHNMVFANLADEIISLKDGKVLY